MLTQFPIQSLKNRCLLCRWFRSARSRSVKQPLLSNSENEASGFLFKQTSVDDICISKLPIRTVLIGGFVVTESVRRKLRRISNSTTIIGRLAVAVIFLPTYKLGLMKCSLLECVPVCRSSVGMVVRMPWRVPPSDSGFSIDESELRARSGIMQPLCSRL